ncbi:hypothetical protein Tco_0645236, partial [Tanacetum coccineum]
MMKMMTSFGDGDDDGVMWMVASVALAGGSRRLVAAPDVERGEEDEMGA